MEISYQESPYKNVQVQEGQTLSSLVLGSAAKHGDKVALINAKTGESITFSGFVERVRNASNGLVQHGVQKGEVVCVVLRNSIHFPVIFHAIIRAGAIATTSNPMFKRDEFLHQYHTAGAKYLVTSADLVDGIEKMFEDAPVPRPKLTFLLGKEGEDSSHLSFNTLMTTAAPSWPNVEQHPDDVIALPFSSGTTSKLKGVVHSHKTLVYSTVTTLHPELEYMKKDDVLLDVVPLFHLFGIITFIDCALTLGTTSVILEWFKVDDFLDSVQKYKVTRVMVAPPVAICLAKEPKALQYDLSSLTDILCSAAPLSTSLYEQIGERFPQIKIRNTFGMTEGNLMVITPPGKICPGSTGVTFPNNIIKVVDESGEICPVGVVGEMYVKGPQIFLGYLDNLEATKETLTEDGWLKSGDLVKFDENGFIFVVDRCKELIKCKGSQVPPAELEAMLLNYKEVADVAVVGVPDEEAGELPKAYVVKQPNSTITEQDVLKYVEDHISPRKRIRLVEFVSSIPKSPSGKILRKILREQEREKAKHNAS